MCGSATLAIVVSSTWSSTAIMIETVRTPWASPSSLSVGTWGCWVAAADAIGCSGLARGRRLRRGRLLGLPRRRRLLLGIDRHVGRKPGKKLAARIAVDRDPHRHALGNLDPIARRILRRQHRKFGARAAADRGDMAADLVRRVGVELDLG